MATANRRGKTRREKVNAANLRAARLQPCRRCGQPIDYDADPDQPDAFNAGHIRSWVDHPELRDDPANLQPEHASCNKSAGRAAGDSPRAGVTSRQW